MAEFTVPDRHRDAVVRVLRLQPEESEHLIRRLNACGSSSAEMISVLDDEVGDGRDVLRALVNFAVFPRRFGITLESIEPAVKDSFDVPDSTFPLGELLNLDGIRKLGKALDLRNMYENILISARVLTDIRPVFNDDAVESVVEAAMVSHTIQLKYRAGDRDPRDLFLAVDTTDLWNIREQIDRAFDKERSGSNFIRNAHATLLEPLMEEPPLEATESLESDGSPEGDGAAEVDR